jgi:hypothetical protein
MAVTGLVNGLLIEIRTDDAYVSKITWMVRQIKPSIINIFIVWPALLLLCQRKYQPEAGCVKCVLNQILKFQTLPESIVGKLAPHSGLRFLGICCKRRIESQPCVVARFYGELVIPKCTYEVSPFPETSGLLIWN